MHPSAGGGGGLSHGDSFVVTTAQIVSGSGDFGTKSGSTPIIWDAGTAATGSIDSQWTGGWPSTFGGGNATYNMALRDAGFRSISAPHSYCSRFYGGCHGALNSLTAGNNVMLYKAFTRPSFPWYSYWCWYQRYDPLWAFNNSGSPGNGGTDDNNNKTFDFSNGSTPYTQNGSSDSNWYAGLFNVTDDTQDVNGYHACTLNDDGTSLQNPDANSHSFFWDQFPSSPWTAWRKWEMEIKHSSTDGGGWIKMWMDNTLVINYAGATDKYTGTSKTEAIGGYARNRDANNWRYFADVGHDRQTTGAARFVLTNNATYTSSTLVENQPYTAYAATSVTLTCNKAAHSAGTKHLHFRCPVNGNKYLGTVTLA